VELKMANKSLFGGAFGTTRNEAGGLAYRYSPRQALAQFALTGCLNRTFYTSAETQLDSVLSLCRANDPEYVAKTAIYAREKGHMKDVPALLCVYLAASKNLDLLQKVFSRVINNGKMLRNFVQILRSGVTGRRSLGTIPKKLVRNWFNARTPTEVFMQSVGGSPTFRDILRLSHPKPMDKQRNALYGWLVGKEFNFDLLPQVIKDFENWKSGNAKETPSVPFDMLTSRAIGTEVWIDIAKRAGWQWLRMNLNTMLRHGVFQDLGIVELVATRLSDEKEIRKARVFPYQIMAAYKNASLDIPLKVREALQDALEIATEAVPSIDGDMVICIDVSGSMKYPITGYRSSFVQSSSDSKVRCVDVAALMSCCLLRKNPQSELLAFNTQVANVLINPRDTVLTNADRVGSMVGGDTACSAPLRFLNEKLQHVDTVWMISDNQSWLESLQIDRYGRAVGKTKLMSEWEVLKERCPDARMVCLDIAPFGTAQTEQGRDDILNVGGIGDSVFSIGSMFLSGELENWSKAIESIELVEEG
jgi:60 kDa SS-A/Ro ribonucleoprotein